MPTDAREIRSRYRDYQHFRRQGGLECPAGMRPEVWEQKMVLRTLVRDVCLTGGFWWFARSPLG